MAFLIGGGQLASISMPGIIRWMSEEGMTGAFEDKKDWGPKDWAEKVDAWALTQEQIDAWENSLIDFFANKTKAEIYEQALKRNIILYPASTIKDLVENIQLEAREFWVDVELPEQGETITYVGAPYKMTETPWRISRRAPLLGEHNQEIYEGELGFPEDKIRLLKEAGVI